MATRESDDAIIVEDAADEWERQREAKEAAEYRPLSGQRPVVSQATRIRMVYHHTLTLSCGHTEYRTGGKVGVKVHRAKCSSCPPAPVIEDAKPRGWLERFITGRRP